MSRSFLAIVNELDWWLLVVVEVLLVGDGASVFILDCVWWWFGNGVFSGCILTGFNPI